MRRLVYLCPETNAPVGGVKVIYRHVEALDRLGVPAFVLHPNDPAFRCTWFAHAARFLDRAELNAAQDFVIVPEVWTLSFGLQCRALGLRYAVLVQNGYILHPLRDDDAAPLRDAMGGADLILSISADTDRMIQTSFPDCDMSRLLRVVFAIPACFAASHESLAEAGGVRTITYMPRKLPEHAARVAFMLRPYLPPHWQIAPVDQVDEAGCAAMLTSSRIFLSFSDLEGLALPPLEAALAGNLVIGYTGQGGAEYWDAPNFHPVEHGNIAGFVRTVQSAAAQIETGMFRRELLWPGMTRLAQRFSPQTEAALLRAMAGRIAALG